MTLDGRRRIAGWSAVVAVVSSLAFPGDATADPPMRAQLRSLDARISASPANVDLRMHRIDLLLSHHRHHRAMHELTHLERDMPSDPRVQLYLARAFLDSGMTRRARDVATRCLTLSDPGSSQAIQAHVVRARANGRLGHLEEAVRDYDQALRSVSTVELHLERGRLLERLGRLGEAAQGYRAGLAAVGRAANLRRSLIEVERRQGHFREALAEIDRVLTVARVDTDWLLLRASVLDEAGRPSEAAHARLAALAEANRLIAIRPSARAHLMRAEVLVALGRRAEARPDLDVAIVRAPGLERARELLRESTQAMRRAR